MFLALLDTVIVSAVLTAWLRHDPRSSFSPLATWSLISAAATLTLPFGAFLGFLSRRDTDRVETLLAVALSQVVVAAFLAWKVLTTDGPVTYAVFIGIMWVPTSLLVLVLERWTRPDPRIPFAVVYKTLL